MTVKSIFSIALGMMLTLGTAATVYAGPAIQYHALGDSYSSGSGTAVRDLDFFCYRSSNAYSSVVAESNSDIALTFNACQGDVTDDIIGS